MKNSCARVLNLLQQKDLWRVGSCLADRASESAEPICPF